MINMRVLAASLAMIICGSSTVRAQPVPGAPQPPTPQKKQTPRERAGALYRDANRLVKEGV